jgi:hypothetical protein
LLVLVGGRDVGVKLYEGASEKLGDEGALVRGGKS